MLDDPHAPGDADAPDSADEPVTANMEVNEPENGSVAFSAGFGGGDTSPFPLYTWPRAWLDRTDINSPQMAEGLGHIAARQAEAVAHYISALTEAQADLEAPLVREAAAALAEVGQGFVLFHQYYTGGMIPTGENLEEDETRRRFAEEEDRLEDLWFDESEDLVEPGPPQNEFGVPLASGIEVASGPWGRIAVSEFVVHSEGIKITLSAVFRQRALSEVFDIDPFSVIAPIEPLDPRDDAVDEIEAEEAAMAAQYSSHGDVRIQPMGREWFPSTDPEFLVASQPLWISPLPTADLEITAAFPHIRVTDAQFTLPAAGIAEARAHIVTVTADDEPW